MIPYSPFTTHASQPVYYQNPPAFKIHPIKINPSQNQTDRNPPDLNQPEFFFFEIRIDFL